MLPTDISLDQDAPMGPRDPDCNDDPYTGDDSEVRRPTLLDDAERDAFSRPKAPDDAEGEVARREAKPGAAERIGGAARADAKSVVFEVMEADTLTTQGALPPRRDTLPVPAATRTPPMPPYSPPAVPPPLAPNRSVSRSDSERRRLVAMPLSAMVEPEGEDLDDALLEDDDDTQTEAEPFVPSDDATSPTLSLANRSDDAREVYRLFLASEYAPALTLANELIAQGDDDPMLVTIARECQSSLATHPQAPSSIPPRFAGVTGEMTLEQLAAMTGMSLDQVLGLLERFVAMGVLTLRPPPR